MPLKPGSSHAPLARRSGSCPASLEIPDPFPTLVQSPFAEASRFFQTPPPQPSAKASPVVSEMPSKGRTARFAPRRSRAGVHTALPNLIEIYLTNFISVNEKWVIPSRYFVIAPNWLLMWCGGENPVGGREGEAKRRRVTNSSASKPVAFTGTCWEVRTLRRCQEGAPLSGRLRSRLGARARLRPPGKPSPGPPGLQGRVSSLPKAEQGEPVLHFKIPPDAVSHSVCSLCNLRESNARPPARCGRALCSSTPSSREARQVPAAGRSPAWVPAARLRVLGREQARGFVESRILLQATCS